MDVELLEIRDFLAGVPPFDALPPDALSRVPASLTVRYLRRGKPFPPDDAEPGSLYVVRQGAIELRNEHDELVAKYGEGDVHDAGEAAAMGGALRGFTVEDTLVYLLPAPAVDRLRASHPEFAHHFGRTLQEKLRRSLDARGPVATVGGQLTRVDVGSLVMRPPVTAPPDATLQEAARIMTRERVSSLLVVDGGRLVGILTDRDLRSRVLAEALPASRTLRDVMSPEVQTLPPTAPAFDALLAMARLGIHHLPIVSGERVLGVVTTTDLVRWQSASTAHLVSAARRAVSVAALQRIAAQLPELQIQMVASSASARLLGLAVGAVHDALTQRLVEMAEARLGPPPAPFAWIVCGSHARHEQTVLTDQDNALVMGDAVDPASAGWFAELAAFVNEGLALCGSPLCPGDVMARNPAWRQTRAGWRDLFDGWIDRPETKAVMHASLFFDMRAVAGDPAPVADVRAHVLQRAKGNAAFLAHMAQNAILRAPPLGFFRGFVVARGGEHADTLDLKRGGIMPIVELARVYALAVGSDALGTVERLRAAADGGALSRAGCEDLEHAFGFVSGIRARHQTDQLKRGEAPDNHVAPATLSRLERTQLKDAFAAIRAHQEALARVYRARSFV